MSRWWPAQSTRRVAAEAGRHDERDWRAPRDGEQRAARGGEGGERGEHRASAGGELDDAGERRAQRRERRAGGFVARVIQRFGYPTERDFVLRVVQPGLVGLIDGSVSSLAPIFAAAISSDSHTAFVVGVATALGAGVSMGMSEALSDTGTSTGRGSPLVRGLITGGMTAVGGIFHTLPFLISNVHEALIVAGIVVAIELFVIAWVRNRFLDVSLRSSLVVVTLGGAIVLAIGVGVGAS